MKRQPTREQPNELGLYTAEQTARILKQKAHTLAVWRCSNRYGLPFIRIGNQVFYRHDDLMAWISRQVVGAEAQ